MVFPWSFRVRAPVPAPGRGRRPPAPPVPPPGLMFRDSVACRTVPVAGAGPGGPPARAGEGNRTLATSLEGWGSTTELHPPGCRRLPPVPRAPPGSRFTAGRVRHRSRRPRRASRSGWRSRWGGEDSNLRRLMPTDLQSVPVGRFGTSPLPLRRIRAASFAPPCGGADPRLTRARISLGLGSTTTSGNGNATAGSAPNRFESQHRDSNPGPAAYKAAALPTELRWPRTRTRFVGAGMLRRQPDLSRKLKVRPHSARSRSGRRQRVDAVPTGLRFPRTPWKGSFTFSSAPVQRSRIPESKAARPDDRALSSRARTASLETLARIGLEIAGHLRDGVSPGLLENRL